MADDLKRKLDDVLERHPIPWHWREEGEYHPEHRDTVLDSDCEDAISGQIELVDANGEVVLGHWVERDISDGLCIDVDVARFIVAAVHHYASIPRNSEDAK